MVSRQLHDLWPVNEPMFNDEDSAAADLTEKPEPSAAGHETQAYHSIMPGNVSVVVEHVAGTIDAATENASARGKGSEQHDHMTASRTSLDRHIARKRHLSCSPAFCTC
jgi:hypothetical protein